MLNRQQRHTLKTNLQKVPFLFETVRGLYLVSSAISRETMTVCRFAPRLIAKRLGMAEKIQWENELPVQKVRRIKLDVDAVSADAVMKELAAAELSFSEGGDSVYLPPLSWQKSALASISSDYPADCGLKIAKEAGDSTGYYMTNRAGRSAAQKLSHPHTLQSILFNFLYQKSIAPRLFDLIEIEDKNGAVVVAYVIQHVEKAPLKDGDVAEKVGALKKLSENEQVELISSAGWNGIDFEEPDCNNNLLRSAEQDETFYVDVHNFVLKNYDKHLTEKAREAISISHFGEKNLILGGEFLYQEIPGVDIPAKRSPKARMVLFDKLLKESGLDLKDKVVFDIGCNLGLMGAEYLRRGARWLHGWDMEEVVPTTKKVLLSIGCSRFSLTGGMLTPDLDLVSQLPAHLKELDRDNCVLNYLAIRGHIGWLPGLKELPWRYMIYESHQEDDPLGEYLEELSKYAKVEVLVNGFIADGTSAKREVAILKRLD